MKKVLVLVFVVFLSANIFPGQDYLNNYTKGNDLFKEGKLLEATDLLKKALVNYPEHIPSLQLLGEIYARLNRYEEAIISFKKVIAINPNAIEARINLADVFAWKGELDRAIGLYKEVLEDEPENISAQLGLAKVFRWAQRYEEAKDQYLHIVEVYPQNIDALKGLSSTYSLLSMYSEAIRTISSAISYLPDNPELYRQKGEILSWQNRFQEAEECLKKSLRLDSTNPETYHSLGNLYTWNKRYEQAVEAYDKAIQFEPKNITHLLDSAKTYLLWNKTFQAEQLLKKALKLDPQNLQALKLIQEIKQKPKFNLMELIERVIEPVLILSIMVIIFIYFQKKIDILKRRHRFYWIFTRYLLPILLCLGFLFFGLALWSDVLEPYTEVATEILELSIMFILCLAFISLLMYKKNHGPVKRNVLVIGAHPDDIELGCGGTMAKLKHDKAKVYAMILSLGEKGGAELEKRIKEARAAAEYLDLDNIWLYNFPDTKLQENINSIILKIENIIKKAKITTIFTHSPNNIHQDHRTVFEACKVAARGDISVVCYEDVSLDQEFIPNYFLDITEFIDIKLKLIKFHKSQREKPYMDFDSIKGRAAHRGLQSGVKYAEAFLSYKIVDK